ncbi:threonine synthase [Kangiella marina]|uniref:Threonine synthase n=1 Tax=Kangiella marina TaxID=1079178 RepID=A0ABP8ILS3_9GAMM
MSFINISQQHQRVSFKDAVLNPIGENSGIYFPHDIKPLDKDIFECGDFHQIAVETLHNLTHNELSKDKLGSMVARAFNFPLELHSLTDKNHILELFHGPTLAFKDFGARFLAECLTEFNQQKATIITATSGDTGAAVAHAFHGQPNVEVVVLYPEGKISKEQEQLFCTLGDNIRTVKVDGNFDNCQSLVKQAFNDEEVNNKLNLNSANSINVARLLAQVCYYTALPTLIQQPIDNLVVPSGNFGNITAALIAKHMGAPVGHLIAATNANDTAPRFFNHKQWLPQVTQRTLSNAMDVSQPNNFSRILYYYQHKLDQLFVDMSALSISDAQTRQTIKELDTQGYQVDPHTAVGMHALSKMNVGQTNNLVVSTAHPAKFADVLEGILQKPISRPSAISECLTKPNLSIRIADDFDDFKEYLLALD